MGGQPLGFGQRDRRWPDPPQGRVVSLDPGRPLEEVEHGKAGGVAGGPAGRQHMVRPGHVVADRLGAGRAEKGGAGVADLGERAAGSATMICRCSGAS